MSNKPDIDFDDVMRKIDLRLNSGASEDVTSLPNFAPQQETGHEGHDHDHDHEGHEHNLRLEEPFIILQYVHGKTDKEGVFTIDSFRMNVGGINQNKEAILAHLKMAVQSLEEMGDLVPDEGAEG